MNYDQIDSQTMNRMKLRRYGGLLLLMIPALVATGPMDLDAQDNVQIVRTLVIKDNQVMIDGQEVQTDELPSAVQLDGVTVSYSFIGVDIPVVTIGDQLYAVQESRLEPIESREQYKTMQARQKRSYDAMANAKGWIVDSERGQYYTFQGERLGTDEAVPRILNEANTLYLEGLQKSNLSLYSRLARERELERQADFLAVAARRAETAEERDRFSAELTQRLVEIFDLKQQNRRDELAQFEAELERLKQRVAKRDELKESIIERHVARLTGVKE